MTPFILTIIIIIIYIDLDLSCIVFKIYWNKTQTDEIQMSKAINLISPLPWGKKKSLLIKILLGFK